MDLPQLFLQRYDVLYDFWLAGVWKFVPHDLMRQRPHPHVNSIAWNLWHLTRVEDAGLNRLVVDRSQVLDAGPWLRRLNIPWRHNGGGMTLPEVEDLSGRIDLAALYDYSSAVQARTREIVGRTRMSDLDHVMDPERLHTIFFDEKVAHSQPEAFVATISGWTKGMCLMNYGLTHPFQHVGEIGVIAGLLGVEF